MNDGTAQEIIQDRMDARQAQFQEVLRVAKLGGDHVWLALASYLIQDPRAAMNGQTLLDAKNLLEIMLGCYRCELTFEPRLLTRRCQGEP